jgi:hypothetical protein
MGELFPLLLIEQSLDRAFEGVDLSITEREQARAVVIQAFPDVMSIALIARYAARRISEHLINPANLDPRNQRIHPRSLTFRRAGRPTDRGIAEHV